MVRIHPGAPVTHRGECSVTVRMVGCEPAGTGSIPVIHTSARGVKQPIAPLRRKMVVATPPERTRSRGEVETRPAATRLTGGAIPLGISCGKIMLWEEK